MKKFGDILIALISRVLLPLFFFSTATSFLSLFATPLLSSDGGDILLLILQTLLLLVMIFLHHFGIYKKEELDDSFWYAYTGYALVTAFVFTITFVISQGSFAHPIFNANLVTVFLFYGLFILNILFCDLYHLIIIIGVTLGVSVLFTTALSPKKKHLPRLAIVIVLLLVVNLTTYFNSPNYKYKGHGFEYMNGFSSTDLSDYTPYSSSNKLVMLDHEANLRIETEEEMPILDGAEACYPVYSAIAKAVYKDIDIIEKEYSSISEHGKIVTFYNTALGYERLFSGDVDMFFGAKPSQSQIELAKEYGVELEYTQIGKEAFVFFVNEHNPIDNLTSDQIRAIYHGDITNFKEVGGENEEIISFQRPEQSGSQAMMEYFMGDVSLKEPLTYETIGAMSGIIEKVAEYHNESGALGYTFKYFLERLNQEKNVKILSIDGVYPTKENIQNGSYPATVGLYCITLKDNDNQNVQKMLEFLLSEDGQYIIEETGYCPMN